MEHAFSVRLARKHRAVVASLGGIWFKRPTPRPRKNRYSGPPMRKAVPHVSMDPDHPGQYVGFEVELRDALQSEIERPIEFKQYSFSMVDSGSGARRF